MTWHTADDAVEAVVAIIETEANRLAIVPLVTTENGPVSNRVEISLRANDKTFHITLKWIKNERVATHGYHLGDAHISGDSHLFLRPTNPQFPVVGPFQWEFASDESSSSSVHPHILEESWLRRLIRKKLAIEQQS